MNAASMFQKNHRKTFFFTIFALLSLVCLVSCKKMMMLPTSIVSGESLHTLVVAPENRQPSAGTARLLGVGWYPQIEVDAQNRVHLAFVDADPGDVRYTVSKPGSLEFEKAQTVEEKGAAGSFLKLALLKNEIPILSYYHQDRKNLRLAHRPNDLKRMKALGLKVDLKNWKEKPPALTFPGMEPDKGPNFGMGSHWHGEDVAFGDQVGQASDLFVGDDGRSHLLYFRKGKVAEYAVRPDGEAVFGVSALGRFARGTMDAKAYASHSMTSDLWVADTGTVWASYGSWEMTETRLRVATKKKEADTFSNFDISPGHRSVEGWHSTILPGKNNKLEVFSLATDIDELLWGEIDRSNPKPLTDRKVLVNRPGPFSVARDGQGTLWVLTRGEGMSSIGDEAGLWLVKIPPKGESQRWILEKGMATDYWFDLALFQDGTPIAIWFSHGIKGLKVYSPGKKVSVQPGMAVASPVAEKKAEKPTEKPTVKAPPAPKKPAAQ